MLTVCTFGLRTKTGNHGDGLHSDTRLVLSLPQDLREKNWKAMDALNSMEKIAQKSAYMSVEIEQKDSLITGLKEELQRAKRQKYVS